MFLKNRNISSKIKRSKVTDYAALIVLIFYCNHSYSYFGFDKIDISPPSSRCPSNFEKKCYDLKFHFFLFHFSKNIICFDFVHSNTYIGFHKIDSCPPALRYFDGSSIFIFRETTMYNKYSKH